MAIDVYQILTTIGVIIAIITGFFKLKDHFSKKPKFEIKFNQDYIEYTEEFEDERWGLLVEESALRHYGEPDFVILRNGTTSREMFAVTRPRFFPRRRFFNIKVKNKGNLEAKECRVKLGLLNKTPIECETHTPNKIKNLCWNNEQLTTDIDTSDSKQFNLFFTQRHFTMDQENAMKRSYCKIQDERIFPEWWIATRDALNDQVNATDDSLCCGEFTFHVEISSRNDAQIKRHFSFALQRNNQKPKVTMEECQCRDL